MKKGKIVVTTRGNLNNGRILHTRMTKGKLKKLKRRLKMKSTTRET